MILNGGNLDGARILSSDSVALMGKNQIGDVGVAALKTAQPGLSMDFTFVDDGKDKWGDWDSSARRVRCRESGQRAASAGAASTSTYFWIDPVRGVAGVILMQFLPFADTKALAIYDTFERGVYQLAGAPLKSSR
jgi:CubicO group peptidase (beta-lactamase class C family)